jgi:hypothetical protein
MPTLASLTDIYLTNQWIVASGVVALVAVVIAMIRELLPYDGVIEMLRFNMLFIIILASALTRADEMGAVTALASVDAGKGAYAGFSSGAVVYCGGTGHECRRVDPDATPGSQVTAIDVFQSGSYPTPTAWVGYENGAIYRCSTHSCTQMSQSPSIKPPDRN